MIVDKNGMCTLSEEDCSYHSNYEPRPLTNADLYRSYSDEQIAELFNQIETKGRAYGLRDKKAWLDWLKQEVQK